MKWIKYFEKFDLSETDILKRLRKAALAKLELFKKYPQIFKFFLTTYVEEDSEVKNDVALRTKKLMDENIPKLTVNIDLSKLKDGIDQQKSLNLIVWALEGYANSKMAEYKTMDATSFSNMLSEFDIYLKILQDCFYK